MAARLLHHLPRRATAIAGSGGLRTAQSPLLRPSSIPQRYVTWFEID